MALICSFNRTVVILYFSSMWSSSLILFSKFLTLFSRFVFLPVKSATCLFKASVVSSSSFFSSFVNAKSPSACSNASSVFCKVDSVCCSCDCVPFSVSTSCSLSACAFIFALNCTTANHPIPTIAAHKTIPWFFSFRTLTSLPAICIMKQTGGDAHARRKRPGTAPNDDDPDCY